MFFLVSYPRSNAKAKCPRAPALSRAPSMSAGRYKVFVAGQVSTQQPLHVTYTDDLAPHADATLSGLSGAAGDTLWIQVGRSVGRSVGWSVGRSDGRSVGRSVGWSVGRLIGRSTRRQECLKFEHRRLYMQEILTAIRIGPFRHKTKVDSNRFRSIQVHSGLFDCFTSY